MTSAKLHPERPLTGDELISLDLGRLDGIIKALTGRIKQYAEDVSQPMAQPEPQLIGIFGGYGHGKSSALRAALRGTRCHERLRTTELDVSLYQAPHLEHRLLRLLVVRPLYTRVALTALAWLLVLLILTPYYWLMTLPFQPIEGFHADCPYHWLASWQNWLALLAGGTASLGLAGWLSKPPPWLSEEMAVLDGLMDRFSYHLAFLFQVQPQVVVVDDLDRASVAQQRAILRALYKHARFLRCLVLVVMDDGPLLAALPGDPEAPDELLRKIIEIRYRVPDRTVEDGVLLAAALCARYARDNPNDPIAPWLDDVDFVSDFASVLVLLGTPAPRRAKRLLADVVARCEVGTPALRQDLHALLRLVGLEELCPNIRQPDRLAALLEQNRDFEPSLLALGLTGELLIRAMRYLNATRHMLPPDPRTLRRLLGGDEGVRPISSSSSAPRPCRILNSKPVVGGGARAYALALGDALRHAMTGFGASGQFLGLEKIRLWPVPDISVETPIWAAIAAAETDPIRRRRLYDTWWSSLADIPPSLALSQTRHDCLRRWLADTGAWRALDRPSRESLLQQPTIEGSYWPLLASLEPEPADLALYLRHLPTSSYNGRLYALVFVHAWSQLVPARNIFLTEGKRLDSPVTDVLQECWPPLLLRMEEASDTRAALLNDFSALGVAMHLGLKVIPSAITGYTGSLQADKLSAQIWLDAFRANLEQAGEWQLEFLHAWQASQLPKALQRLLRSEISEQFSRKAWLTALALAHHFDQIEAVRHLLSAPVYGAMDGDWLLAVIGASDATALWQTLQPQTLEALGMTAETVAQLSPERLDMLQSHLQSRLDQGLPILEKLGLTEVLL